MSKAMANENKDDSRLIEQKLAILKEIGLAFESTMSLEEILSLVVEKTTKLMRAERSTLFLTTESGELVSRMFGGEGISEIRLKPGQGIAGWIARTNRPVLVPDAYQDDRFDSHWDKKFDFVTRCVLGCPIRGRNGGTIGVIEVLNKAGDETFDQDDLELLGLLAGQLALTIENASLLVDLVTKNQALIQAKLELELSNQELTLLLELEKLVARADNLDELVFAVLERMIGITGARLGIFHLLDDTGAEMRIVIDINGELHDQVLRVERSAGFSGWVAIHSKELCLTDPMADPRFRQSLATRIGIQLNNLAAVPVYGQGGRTTKGSLLVANRDSKHGFDEPAMVLLRLMASRLSLALEHYLDRETRERDRRLATVGRLLASVLHDLKTPITVVSGYAELLASKSGDQESLEYLDHIRRSLAQISGMAEEIIRFSKGERQLLAANVRIDEFMERFMGQLKPQLEAQQIELRYSIRTSGRIRVDEEKFLRAFNNIVCNAIEVMGPGGRLTIEVDRVGNEVVFGFTDTGPGIPEKIQGSIFESFVTMGKDQGTGLGLAVAREVVEAHHGKINFSTVQGEGTTFLISLPS